MDWKQRHSERVILGGFIKHFQLYLERNHDRIPRKHVGNLMGMYVILGSIISSYFMVLLVDAALQCCG